MRGQRMKQLKELIEKLGQEQADSHARKYFDDEDAFVCETHLFDGINAIVDIDVIVGFLDSIKVDKRV